MKVLLWDIDGTLLNFEEAEKASIQHCFDKFGLGVCTEEMLMHYHGINRGYWKRLELGEITKPEVLIGRFRDFFTIYGMDVSLAKEFNDEYQISLGDTVVFCRNAQEILEECRGKVLQYAVTNGTKIAQDRKLKNSGLITIFDGVFISEEVGYEKPAVEFFEEVFRVIGTYEPSEVLIVGDSLTSDICGGNNMGIKTCWYNPEKKENDAGVTIDYEIEDLIQVLELI